jgi:hypothetical protein
MTALKEYARLESVGVWRESPETQRRDVVLRFGEASLVIASQAGNAIAHWSLAAILRTNPDEKPAIYAPAEGDPESLEIGDETMIDAIEKVRRLIARRRPRRGRLRAWLLAALLALVLGLLLFWMPGALRRHALAVVPEAAEEALGRELMAQILDISGRPCASPDGEEALAALSARLLGPEGSLAILPGGVEGALALPGGIVLLGRDLVEDHDTPGVAAGYVLAELLRRDASDPLRRLLEAEGIGASFRLLTTGRVPEPMLARHAERLLTEPSRPVPDEALLARFAEARVSAAPYAYALDPTGETTLALIEADPLRDGGTPLMADDAWVSLQGICGE